jgi:hypothetical protein
MTPVRQSGVQKQVYALYRSVLRQAYAKDREALASRSVDNAGEDDCSFVACRFSKIPGSDGDAVTTTSYAAAEFKRQALTVKRSEFKKIEYMIRKGERQVKLLQMPGVTSVHGMG